MKKDFYTENISLSTLKSNHPKAAATIIETISITDSKAKKDDNTDLEIDTTNVVFLQKEDGFKSYTFKVKQEKGLHYFRNIIITDSPDKKTEVVLVKFNLSKKLEDTRKEEKINQSVISIETLSLKNFKVKKSMTEKSNSYGEICIQIGHWVDVEKCEGELDTRPGCYESDGVTKKTIEVFIVELSGCSSGGSSSQNNGGITVGTPPTDYNPSTGTGGGGDGNESEFLGIFIPNPYEGEAELTNPDFVFSTQVNYFLSTLISGNYGLTDLFQYNTWVTPAIVQFLKKEGGLTPANKAIVANALNNFIQIYNTDLSYMSDVEKNIFLYNTLNYFLNDPDVTWEQFEELLSFSKTMELNLFSIISEIPDYKSMMSNQEILIFNSTSKYNQIKYLGCAKKAFDTAAELFPTTFIPSNLHNGKGDAFRHAYWNCLSSYWIGKTLTIQLTTAHEQRPPNPDNPFEYKEVEMDLFNNNVGINIASYSNLNTFKENIIFRLNAGDLVYLNNLDNTSNHYPTLYSQLTPTNQ